MLPLILALVIGSPESMRPVEFGASPAASEVRVPMTKKVDESEAEDNDERRARRAQARRGAVLVSFLFSELAELTLDADDAEIDRVRAVVDAAYKDIHLRLAFEGVEEDTFAKLALLYCLETAFTQFEQLDPPQPDLVRYLYSAWFPNHAESLTDEDLCTALENWGRGGGARKKVTDKAKFDHLAEMFARAGIGKRMKGGSLQSRWSAERHRFFGLSPFDMLRRRHRFTEAFERAIRRAKQWAAEDWLHKLRTGPRNS